MVPNWLIPFRSSRAPVTWRWSPTLLVLPDLFPKKTTILPVESPSKRCWVVTAKTLASTVTLVPAVEASAALIVIVSTLFVIEVVLEAGLALLDVAGACELDVVESPLPPQEATVKAKTGVSKATNNFLAFF